MQVHPLSVQIDVYNDDETCSQLMILYKYQTFTNDFAASRLPKRKNLRIH